MTMRNCVGFSHGFVINSIAGHAGILNPLMEDGVVLAGMPLEMHINNGFPVQAKRHLCSDD